jgi:hypothetical protein
VPVGGGGGGEIITLPCYGRPGDGVPITKENCDCDGHEGTTCLTKDLKVKTTKNCEFANIPTGTGPGN